MLKDPPLGLEYTDIGHNVGDILWCYDGLHIHIAKQEYSRETHDDHFSVEHWKRASGRYCTKTNIITLCFHYSIGHYQKIRAKSELPRLLDRYFPKYKTIYKFGN